MGLVKRKVDLIIGYCLTF